MFSVTGIDSVLKRIPFKLSFSVRSRWVQVFLLGNFTPGLSGMYMGSANSGRLKSLNN